MYSTKKKAFSPSSICVPGQKNVKEGRGTFGGETARDIRVHNKLVLSVHCRVFVETATVNIGRPAS